MYIRLESYTIFVIFLTFSIEIRPEPDSFMLTSQEVPRISTKHFEQYITEMLETFIYTYGCVWVSKEVYGVFRCLRVSMDVYGYFWVSSCLSVSLNVCIGERYVWLSKKVYGCL